MKKRTQEERITQLENRLAEMQLQMKEMLKLLEAKEKESKLWTATPREGLEQATTEKLIEIGIQTNLRGFQYIKEAVMMTVEDPDAVGMLTKHMYPNIAKKHGTTETRVERCIRHAIENSVDRCSVDVMYDYFGESISGNKGKPTNGQFISNMAEHLRLEGY